MNTALTLHSSWQTRITSLLRLTIASLVLFGSAALADQNAVDTALQPTAEGWELQKDKDGIQVYFRDVPGSEIQAFMGVTTMQASLSSIVKALQSDQTCQDWVEGCIRAETLEGALFEDFYQYGVNHLPWPADNRDYVIRVQTQAEGESGDMVLSLNAVDGMVPETDNVRLQKMTIRYYLHPLDSGQTSVTWVQHTEPGGYIPDWLVNMLLVDIPFYSLQRLEQVAQQPGYRDAEFVLDEQQQVIGLR